MRLRLASLLGLAVALLGIAAGGSTGTAAAPSAAVERIVFATSWTPVTKPEVSVVGLDGGKPVNVSRNPRSDVFSSWSPDGKWLAVGSDRGDGTIRLYAMRVDGSARKLLADGFGNIFSDPWPSYGSSSWSPDGKQIAVGLVAPAALAVVDVASGRSRIVARLAGGNDLAEGGGWSPDGRWIAYKRSVYSPSEGGLWVVRPDGTQAHQVSASADDAVWSPDGGALAYADGSAISVADPDGGAPVRVAPTRGSSYSEGPAWSPDGSRLAAIDGNAVVVISLAGGGGTSTVAAGNNPHCVSWSPDGRLLAFRRDQDVVVTDISGTETRVVGVGGLGCPHWSPNRSTLEFVVQRPSGDSIAVVNADGSALRELTPRLTDLHEDRYLDPWSPRGDAIAYTWLRQTNQAIFSVDPDGRRLVQLTHDPTHDLFAPAWSPDHRRIAYIRGTDGLDDWHSVFRRTELYVMDARGRGSRRVAQAQLSERTDPIHDPAWSPDGQTIAFADYRHIHTVRAAGGGLRTITTDPGYDAREPAWSPDGRALAYTSCSAGSCAIYVVDADGKNRRRLIGGGRCTRPKATPWSLLDAYAPTWSPDGKRIAYVTSCYTGKNQASPGIVETIRPDGRGRTVLARPAGPAPAWRAGRYGAAELAWSPDGKKLVVSLGTVRGDHGHRFRLGLVTVAGGALAPLLPTIESPTVFGPDW